MSQVSRSRGSTRPQTVKTPQDSDYYHPAESVDINAEELQSRLYATSEIHTNSGRQLKVVRRRANTSDVS